MHRAILPVLLMLGCKSDENGGFSYNGANEINDWLGDTQTGGSGGSGDDTGWEDGVPYISQFAVYIDNDYPGYDFVFAFQVAFTDTDDNVDGGYLKCSIEVDGGDTEPCTEDDSIEDGKLPIDGLNPFIEDGVVYLYLDPGIYNEDQEFYFEVSLFDTDDNESNTSGVAAAPI